MGLATEFGTARWVSYEYMNTSWLTEKCYMEIITNQPVHHHMASQPRRPCPESSLLGKLQILN